MATGTGLPINKSTGIVAQPTTVLDGDKFSSALAWQQMAQSGQKLANASFDYLQRDAELQRASAVADFENRHRDWFVKSQDEFYGKPAEFEVAGRAHIEGTLAQIEPALVNHAKSFMGGLLESGIANQLSVKRAKDQQLATERLEVRLKTADDDVQSLASAGRLRDDNGKAAVIAYSGILDTAVTTGAMTAEKADMLREDSTVRAQGNLIRNGLEKIYAEKGFEEARTWLKGQVNELGEQYKFSDKLLRGGLAWLRSEESANRGARDGISREWAVAKSQAATLPNDTLLDIASRAYEVGNIRVGQEVEATVRSLEIVKQVRALPLSDRVALATSGEVPADTLQNRLIKRESGGRTNLINTFGYAGLFQFGAPRLTDLGVYRPGPSENLEAWSKTPRTFGNKWSGEFQIPGFPEVKTIDDFRSNPGAQRAVFGAHIARMDQEITARGLERFEGKTIGGVPITRDGIRAMIHLGGADGARKALESGGGVNPKDANGTSLLDYARMGLDTTDVGENLTRTRPGLMALNTLKREMAADLDHSIADLTSANRKTEFPSLDEIYALGIQAAAVGSPEQKRKVAEIATLAEVGARFQTLTAQQRSVAIDQWSKRLDDGAPEFTRKLGSLLESADKRIAQAYQTDPYAAQARFARSETPEPPLQFGQPTTMDALRKRTDQQNEIRADQDLPAFSALRPAEAGALATQLTQGNMAAADNALVTLSALPREVFVATMTDKPIREALDGMVRSYDPGRLNAGMGALDRVWRSDPVGFRAAFGAETLARLQVWQSLRGSLSPQEIADQFKRSDDPAFAEARKRLADDAASEVSKTTPGDIAKSIYATDHGFLGMLPFTGPAAPTDGLQSTALTVEFETLYKDFRSRGLDAGKAKEQALARLKTTWGASEINGDMLMRYPPERFYGDVDGSRAWMRAFIEQDLTAIVGKPRISRQATDLGPVSTKSWDYRILADAQTEADIAAGRPPSYLVNVIDADGRIDVPLDAAGNPMRYRWDDKAALDEARSSFGRLRFLKINANPNAGGITPRAMLDPLGEIGPR